jgi:large repetitive protein
MSRRSSCVSFLVVLFACMQLPGCGGSSTTLLAISTTALPKGTVNTPYSAALLATGGTTPYTWSQASGGAMPAGVTLSSGGLFSGTPTAAGTFGPYVFKVTDSSTTQQTASSASLSITISSSSLSVTTTSLPNGNVGTAYSAMLAASGGSSPYSWSETSGGLLPPGLAMSSGGVFSGTPTTAGTYGPYVFTVEDTNSTTAISSSLTITITGTTVAVCTPLGNEAALTSATPYAFLLKGTDGSGNPIDVAGSFTPNGLGGIASATADYNGFTNGPEPLLVNLSASSYAFSTSAQGCLYLAFSGLASADVKPAHLIPTLVPRAKNGKTPAIVAAPLSNVEFSFYLSSFDGTIYHTGRIIESDSAASNTNASGFIHVQDPTAFTVSALQSNYAFGVDGWTATPTIVRTSMAGTFTNSSGTLSAGYADMNVDGTASGELSGGYGTLVNTSIDTTTGRATGTYFTTTASGQLTFDFAFYILNGSDLILLSTDLASEGTTTPLLAGRALASNASYAPGALNGYFLLSSQGLQTIGVATGNIAEIGTLNATSAGAIPTATIYSNYAGTYASNQYPSSSYTVEAASGRVAITGLTAAPPVVYLTAGNTSDDEFAGFLVGTDPQTSSGYLVSQTTSAPSYSIASVTGAYASSTEEDLDGLNGSFLGAYSFSGTGGYTLTSQTTGTLLNVPPSSGAISVNADGSGTLNGGNFPFVTNGTVLLAIPNSGDPLLFVLTEVTLP